MSMSILLSRFSISYILPLNTQFQIMLILMSLDLNNTKCNLIELVSRFDGSLHCLIDELALYKKQEKKP